MERSSPTVIVHGYGIRFERRYGVALENAGFTVVKARTEPALEAQAMVVSFLDGDPLSLPEASDPRLAKACVWIDDAELPEGYPEPAVMLGVRASAEELLFHLGSVVPGHQQRRQDERRLLACDVRYRSRAGETPVVDGRSQLTNLSLGGAFIRSLAPPPVGHRLQLEIEMDSSAPPVVLEARVVHRLVADLEIGFLHNPEDPGTAHPGHPGFAVAFDVSSFETRSMLARTLRILGWSGPEYES